jgi:tungstate transport system ATP-binding protein
MDTSAYELRDVRVVRAEHVVLEIPSLTIAGKRVTAVVGPNGAGKSTLLRLLAFLLSPTSGTVMFRGEVTSGRWGAPAAARRQVTLVAQSPLLFRRSVGANLTYGLRGRGVARDERVSTALTAVGLDGFAERAAWKLSGGEVQRVAIARALTLDPPVYLFDEPTANVDREHVSIVETLITHLGAAGRTVVFATHNLAQAYRISDTVISLVAGRLAPAPLVNLLRGTVTRDQAATYFESGGMRIEIAGGAEPWGIAIDPEDIVLSRQPLVSDARNHFPGRIIKSEGDERGMLVTIDCGHPLVARVSRRSYEELALNVGAQVQVTFKSSAIHLIDA